MSGFSRRELLSSGLALSGASLLARSTWARTAELIARAPDAASIKTSSAIAPREHLLFDFGWRFTFGHGTDPTRDLGFGYGQGDFAKTGDFEFSKAKFDDSKWRTLNLPHDWAVELPFVHDDEQMSHGYKPLGRRYPDTSVGWYRREFDVSASDQGRRVSVEFDGAFRDVLVFVNGCFVGRNNMATHLFSSTYQTSSNWAPRITSSLALTPVSATGGSMRALASIAMYGSRRLMPCTSASGTVPCAPR